MSRLHLTVVTPCRNAGPWIARTIRSVVDQTAVRSGRVALQYLVMDGGSSDGTVEVARREAAGAADVHSAPDRGMYDALAKGLRLARGEVVCYLNAGDLFSPTAFEVVADLFARPGVDWLTGMNVACNEQGAVVSVTVPPPFDRALLRKGAHDGRVLPHVQQESTFWRRSLLAGVSLEELASYDLAGDAWLWTRLAREAELVVVEAYLGGFTFHRGQRSERREEYAREVARFQARLAGGERLRAWLLQRAWLLPSPWKKRLRPGRFLRYSFERGSWE